MDQKTQNSTDDFFSLIEKEQKIEDPFADDEILFRDTAGSLKLLKGGEVSDFQDQKDQKNQVGHLTTPGVGIKTTERPSGKLLNVDQEVETVTKKSGIHFSDPEAKQRFKNIVGSRFKGVRSRVETRETLLDSLVAGGMGFSSEQADKVMVVLNQETEVLDDKLRQQVSNEPFSDLKVEAKKLLDQSVVEVPQASPVVFQPRPATAPKPQGVKTAAPEIKAKTEAELKPKPQGVKISRPLTRPDTTRPKIEDVKFKPQLTGPVQEIKSMTLIDFRRLAETPEQAIEKILEKIDTLEEESFVKKTQAIKAWKENEISRLYLDLGDQSMDQKKPIAEIINDRKQAGQPYLTEAEIDAIIDLNKKLRY